MTIRRIRKGDSVVVIAGREFVLWIVRDAQHVLLNDDHRKLLRDNALKPGVEDFAQRILLADSGALASLEPEIRVLK